MVFCLFFTEFILFPGLQTHKEVPMNARVIHSFDIFFLQNLKQEQTQHNKQFVQLAKKKFLMQQW